MNSRNTESTSSQSGLVLTVFSNNLVDWNDNCKPREVEKTGTLIEVCILYLLKSTVILPFYPLTNENHKLKTNHQVLEPQLELSVQLRDISRKIIICVLVTDVLFFAVYVWTFVFSYHFAFAH